MHEHINSIRVFMGKAGQETYHTPTVPNPTVAKLRASLILEECLETIEALGFEVKFSNFDGELYLKSTSKKPDLVEIADGIADISVVSHGTAIACGIDMIPIIDLVDKSNLAKFEQGGYKRDDGKWVKPPHWIPPDIEGELKKQTMEFLNGSKWL